MDDVSRVNVETASKQLIHEILDVVISKILARVDDSMHVRLHQICNDVDIFVAGLGGRLCHIDQSDDVLMLKEFQKFDLSYDSLCVN